MPAISCYCPPGDNFNALRSKVTMDGSKTAITVAYGDGVGPEIMTATLRILDEAGAKLECETIEIGQNVYERGFTSGMEPGSWDSLRKTKVLLKGPITTPQGKGYKSLNVTIRKSLGLYANVRPCVAYAPFVKTYHPEMNVVIVRENEEDLYAGIEHRQTDDVMQCLKLITRPGCEKIVRYAFAYAKHNRRQRVTCMTKDNIMKLTDGLFHRVFDEIGAEYPEIAQNHQIIDIGAARLADTPEIFDVIVTPNLYGDIISDIAAQVAGSVGLAPSANIGGGGGDVRGDSRLRPGYCRSGRCESFRPSFSRRDDACPYRPGRGGRAGSQRLPENHRGRDSYRRYLRFGKQGKGRNAGIFPRNYCPPRRGADAIDPGAVS